MPNLFLKKNKPSKNSPLAAIFWWTAVLCFNTWFFWIIINPTQKGVLGNFIFDNLNRFLGLPVYLLPFLTFYGLIAILLKLGKPNKGIITLSSGIILLMISMSSILEFFKTNFVMDFFNGGTIGYLIQTILSKIFGNFGSFIFSFFLLIIGIQIVFKLSWSKLIMKLINQLKIDYKQWCISRDEFKSRLKTIKEKEEKKEKLYDLKPIPISIDTAVPIQTEEKTEKAKKEEAKEEKKESRKQTEEYIKNSYVNEKNKQNSEYLMFKNFKLPTINLLNQSEKSQALSVNDEDIQKSKEKLQETLKNFEINAFVSGIYPGPVITRYEVTPAPGVKISSIVSLSNDIALAMRAQGIRVIAPIPGKAAIGFEIPNSKRAKVSLREILESSEFNSAKGHLSFAIGKHADGSPAVANLEAMPHLLVAGATGSGKSVFLQSLIISIIYRNTPDEVKFLFIDPKRLELTFYEAIPYLYDPKVTPDKVSVITDAKEAAKSLVALTRLMDKRYKKFEKARVKNISAYNKWAIQNNQPKEFYIVVVIDELADLMLQAKNVVEENIQRLAQMARAVGIHLVLATQRPSVDVITGVIKANLPSRIALQVSSKIDSRVIIDMPGAESLIGKGDMLYLGIENQKPERIQGCYVSEEEIEKIVEFIKAQGGPNYPAMVESESQASGKGGSSEELIVALKLVMERKRVSQDLLKAHFGSSARATNILSLLEVRGFIHKPEGTNRWEIFFDKIEDYLNSVQGKKEGDNENNN
jgi:S-DNA-T family DNA segregation ATPase FtsK/SpoIIIE